MCLQLAVRGKNLPDAGFLQRETGGHYTSWTGIFPK